MTTNEKKEFPCPSCGVASWLDPLTFQVTHAEPLCADWTAMQSRSANAIQVGELESRAPVATVTHLAPAVVDFTCPECAQPARMHPRQQPIGVEHSLPVCKLWEKITGKKDDVERYLIKAGVHIYAPQHELTPRENVGEPGADSDDAGGQK